MILTIFGTFFCNFGVFLAKNQKYSKITVFKKWKMKIFFLKIEQFFSNIIYHSLNTNFLILFFCFVICYVLGPFFYRLSDFYVFQYCEKCVPLSAKPFSMFQYLNSTKLPIKWKVPVNALKIWFGSKEGIIGNFLNLNFTFGH